MADEKLTPDQSAEEMGPLTEAELAAVAGGSEIRESGTPLTTNQPGTKPSGGGSTPDKP